MISFKQFLIENEILEDDNTPKDGVTLYYGYKKDRKHATCFVAVEYENGELVNVYDKIDFNYSMPFDGSTGKISKSATKRSNEVVQSIEKMSGKSITKKVEMYLQRVFSTYKEVGKGITVKALCKFIQDILNTASDVLKSIFYSKGHKYYDRVTESEDLDFDDVIKQLKKLIKKYTK